MVRSLTDELLLEVRVDPVIPWAPLMLDPEPILIGTTQRSVQEGASMRYNAPRLAQIGGFFLPCCPKRMTGIAPQQYGLLVTICYVDIINCLCSHLKHSHVQFFWVCVPSMEVGSIGCVNFIKPFVLPSSLTFKMLMDEQTVWPTGDRQ